MQEGTPIIIKKKKVSGHGHHGGAWKVAYADFVTAMMAFFMVMWIVGLSSEDRNVIQSYFNDPVGFANNMPRNPVNIGPTGGPRPTQAGEASADTGERKETEVMTELHEKIETQVQSDPTLAAVAKSGGLAINSTSEGLAIEFIENEMNGEVFFRIGSDEVRPQARKMIQRLAPVIAQSGRPIFIDGHTDALPYPGVGYDNYDLSTDRAQAVRRILLAGGVKARQVLAVRGSADQRPLLKSDPTHFSNRRVTILLPYKYAEEPVLGLPADVNRDSIEGRFRFPDPVKPSGLRIRP